MAAADKLRTFFILDYIRLKIKGMPYFHNIFQDTYTTSLAQQKEFWYRRNALAFVDVDILIYCISLHSKMKLIAIFFLFGRLVIGSFFLLALVYCRMLIRGGSFR